MPCPHPGSRPVSTTVLWPNSWTSCGRQHRPPDTGTRRAFDFGIPPTKTRRGVRRVMVGGIPKCPKQRREAALSGRAVQLLGDGQGDQVRRQLIHVDDERRNRLVEDVTTGMELL